MPVSHAAADLDIGVIYTYERNFMSPLVTSLARSGDGIVMRLLIVDNCSEEGVSEWTTQFRNTDVLKNDRRLGYAENLNRILAASAARYVLLLNTDMLFDPAEQCLAKMVRFMDAHPHCGVSGCRLTHADGTDAHPARRFQTLRTIAARRLGMSNLLAGEMSSYLCDEQRQADVIACDWLSGCFLMVRREAYQQIGPLDTGFRKYFEDVDYCLRMARGGWQVLLNNRTTCCHLEQRASQNLLSRDAWLHLRSYTRFLRKWGFDPGRHILRNRQLPRAA
jgi:N-acetylglucosaminyl-diphospho-decaprenol L-rhamnosyltransferase